MMYSLLLVSVWGSALEGYTKNREDAARLTAARRSSTARKTDKHTTQTPMGTKPKTTTTSKPKKLETTKKPPKVEAEPQNTTPTSTGPVDDCEGGTWVNNLARRRYGNITKSRVCVRETPSTVVSGLTTTLENPKVVADPQTTTTTTTTIEPDDSCEGGTWVYDLVRRRYGNITKSRVCVRETLTTVQPVAEINLQS